MKNGLKIYQKENFNYDLKKRLRTIVKEKNYILLITTANPLSISIN